MGVYRGLLFALIGGIASAILSIGPFGSAPLLAIGLALGSPLAGISAGTAALLVLLNFHSIGTLFYTVTTGLPALLVIRLALISQPGATPNTRDWYPVGQILAAFALYGVFALVVVAIFIAMMGSSLETVSRSYLTEFFAQLMAQSEVNFRSDADKELVKSVFDVTTNQLAPLLVGYLIAVYLLVVIGIAAITQRILGRGGLSLRPALPYITLELPRWLIAAFAVAVIIAILPGTIGVLGRNAVLILSIPFLLLGLTVIHTLSRRTPNPGMVLVAIYFALFLLVALFKISLPIMALLVLLGITEQWSSLRQRLTAPDADKEDE